MNIQKIVENLKNGGVALLPTDTVYGLAVMPDNTEGIKKLFKLKNRPNNVNLPIMVADILDIEKLGLDINENILKLLKSDFVPGHLTIILGFNNQNRPTWLAEREEVAIRIPNHKNLLSVLKQTGALLVTSANKHGNSTPNNIEEILKELDGKPDIYSDEGKKEAIASTIINCRTNPPTIEREGIISSTELFNILNNE